MAQALAFSHTLTKNPAILWASEVAQRAMLANTDSNFNPGIHMVKG